MDCIAAKMMEMVFTTAGIRHAKRQSNQCHQQTNTQLFTGRMVDALPVAQPTVSKHWREKYYITFHRLAHPRLTWGFPMLSLTIRGSWLPWGRIAMPLISDRTQVQANNEKVLKEMQTLRAGCSKAEPKIFAPPQIPFPGSRDGQNLISWRWSLPSPTNPVWWRSMYTISSYRGNRPTNTQTRCLPARTLQTCPQTGPITIHCALSLVRSAIN